MVRYVMGYNRALAALFCLATNGETLSQVAAYRERMGSRSGCMFCRFLHYAVEPDHCDKALAQDMDPTSGWPAARAGALLLLGTLLPFTLACWAAWNAILPALGVTA